MLFDASPADHIPNAAGWHAMQQTVLSALIASIPKLPLAVHPQACQLLREALQAVTIAERDTIPSRQAPATSLHAIVARAFHPLGGC